MIPEYGYSKDQIIHDFIIESLPFALLFLATLLLIFSICIFVLHYKRKQKIFELIKYAEKISQGNYDLKMSKQSEDDLSILQEEIYKIMVLLRESAEQNSDKTRELEKAMQDISHQLKTPLSSALILTENIKNDPDMPASTRQDFLRDIEVRLRSMTTLVSTLLNLAKLESGTITLKSHSENLFSLLKSVCGELEVFSELAEVKLIISGDHCAKASIDKTWQKQAFLNILKNCIEHSAPRSKVEIKVEQCPLYSRITITDHGSGIPEKDLPYIFDRFYKTEHSSPDSIGIGLSFAKTVIESNGGVIRAHSEDGVGTSFIVTFHKVFVSR